MKPECAECDLITGVLQESANNHARLSEKYEYARRALDSIATYKPDRSMLIYAFYSVRDMALVALDALKYNEELP